MSHFLQLKHPRLWVRLTLKCKVKSLLQPLAQISGQNGYKAFSFLLEFSLLALLILTLDIEQKT